MNGEIVYFDLSSQFKATFTVESAMKLLAISLAFLVSSTHAWMGDGNHLGTTVEPGATETPMGPPDYVIEPMGPPEDYDAFRSLKRPPKYSTQELLTLQRQNKKVVF